MRGGPCGTPRNVSLPRTMAIRSSRDTAATLAADSTDDPNSGDRLDRDRHLLSGGEDGGNDADTLDITASHSLGARR